MKSLVTKKEEKVLKELLALSPVEEVTLTYFELRGYIYGIAITPDSIQPEEWLPIVFGDELPQYGSEAQARHLTSTLFTVLNKHIAAFHNGSLHIPFDLENMSVKDFDNIFEWASGFEEALALRPEYWEESGGLSDDDHDHLMNSLIIIEGIVYPEDAVDMFDHLSQKELRKIGIHLSGDEIDKIAQIQFFMLQALELAVETIQKHSARLEIGRKNELRSSSAPLRLHSADMRKDVACPCGSGKSFSKCCGLPVPKGGSREKKGQVIKVDFPQHGKKDSTKQRKEKSSANHYQFEITLSFTSPEVWRRILVPDSYTLAELHQIIQLTMGWQDCHLHQFQAGTRFYGPQLADDYRDMSMLDESRFSLADLQQDLLQGIVYTYDFGDSWEHVILLEKVTPEREGKACPLLLEGARACPPEDIGGVPMYQEFLNYLAGNGDEELDELFDEPSLQGYDPTYFEPEEINKLLRKFFESR